MGTNERTGKPELQQKLGKYQWQKFREVKKLVSNLAKGLIANDLTSECSDDNYTLRCVGIFAKNSAKWIITDLACAYSDTTCVTLYDTLGEESTAYIINQTELKTIFCTADKIPALAKLKSQEEIPTLENIVLFDSGKLDEVKLGEDTGLHVFSLESIINSGKESTCAVPHPTSESIFTLCYTSGTTGDPKGAMITHRNIVVLGGGLARAQIDINEKDTHISYLPLAHIFERAVIYTMIANGAAVGFFGGDTLKIKDDIAVLRPTIFASVPRLYNRIYDGMKAKINELTGFKAKLAQWGIEKKLANLAANGAVTHATYDKILFNKFKAGLGGRVRLMITGSAPLEKQVIDFLKIAMCCPFFEGYGSTETTAAACLTHATDAEAGHVGAPMAYSEMKLVDIPEMDYLSTDEIDGVPAPRGEVCFKGHNIFAGYFKMPDKTREAIDEDGWCHTGDIGMLRPNGSLKIIDRKKNIFKLSQGEYIAPDKLENGYTLIPMIQQIFVYGDSLQPHLVAVIVPDPAVAKAWAEENDQDAGDYEALIGGEPFKKALEAELKRVKGEKKFNGMEIPKKLHITSSEFTIENGTLTPSMKLKRADAKKMYLAQIKEMYGGAKLQGED